jgi:hypothetical protein
MMLNRLKLYCEKWGFVVNVAKSKVMVFSNTPSKNREPFWYNRQKLEIVKQFRYLGMSISENGSYQSHVEYLHGKAKRSMFNLRKFRWRFPKIQYKSLSMMFDTLISPILLYGSEICAGNKLEESTLHKLDIVHDSWCRSILGVPRGTPGPGVRHELDRTRVSTIAQVRAVNYFLRVSTTPRDRLTYHALIEQKRMVETPVDCWGKGIKRLLDNSGYGFVWNFDFGVYQKTRAIGKNIRRRLENQDRAENITMMRDPEKSKQLKYYWAHKNYFTMPNYGTTPYNERRWLSIFRLNCVYSLPIQKSQNEERYECKKCKGSFPKPHVWHHFVYECSNDENRSACSSSPHISAASKHYFDMTTAPTSSAKSFRNKLVNALVRCGR